MKSSLQTLNSVRKIDSIRDDIYFHQKFIHVININ